MRDDFANRKTSQGIHYSRYIASYRRVCDKNGIRYYEDEFEDWLRSIGLSDEEINDITWIANNGRMEEEGKAFCYLKKNHPEIKKL